MAIDGEDHQSCPRQTTILDELTPAHMLAIWNNWADCAASWFPRLRRPLVNEYFGTDGKAQKLDTYSGSLSSTLAWLVRPLGSVGTPPPASMTLRTDEVNAPSLLPGSHLSTRSVPEAAEVASDWACMKLWTRLGANPHNCYLQRVGEKVTSDNLGLVNVTKKIVQELTDRGPHCKGGRRRTRLGCEMASAILGAVTDEHAQGFPFLSFVAPLSAEPWMRRGNRAPPKIREWP